MDIGVFIPINNGWLTSETSPRHEPSVALNRTVVEQAERFGTRIQPPLRCRPRIPDAA